MRVKSNLRKDRFFLRLVKTGRLAVTKRGVVTNLLTGRVIGKNDPRLGYARVSYQHPKTKTIYNMLVHRLVWIVYRGLIDDPSIKVNHKDGDKRNNRLRNLELVTNSGNLLHAYATGLMCATGENNSQALFTDRQVCILRKKFFAGKITEKYITEKYGCHVVTARQMLDGTSYSHLDFAQPIPKKSKLQLLEHMPLIQKMKRKGYSNQQIALKLNARGITASRSSVQRALVAA